MKKPFCILLLLSAYSSLALAELSPEHAKDPHYNEAGFFDIHVCNWPDTPLFFMMLFSSYEFKQIKSIKVYSPDNESIGNIALNKFRIVKKEGKPEKRVFIQQQPINPAWKDGWYSATIEYNNGTTYSAKDFVIIQKLDLASNTSPAPNAEQIILPQTLSWQVVAGAKYYQVFLRDLWNDGKLIFQSEILRKSEVELPPGLLERDGMYSWRIHARDINEDVKLGDFNSGSLSNEIKFTTQP